MDHRHVPIPTDTVMFLTFATTNGSDILWNHPPKVKVQWKWENRTWITSVTHPITHNSLPLYLSFEKKKKLSNQYLGKGCKSKPHDIPSFTSETVAWKTLSHWPKKKKKNHAHVHTTNQFYLTNFFFFFFGMEILHDKLGFRILTF